jgi:CDP-diacylglycerol--glycerol-3-phosphate 3-phosphatidyltransferase
MNFLRRLPNLLSGLRIALVPVLLWIAWTGHPVTFLWTFALSLSTDLLDGFVARRFHANSELGARLDSWGDLATYAVVPLCTWWLYEEKVLAQLVLVVIALVAFVAPTLIGLAKFRRLPSYHTRLAKLSAILMGGGLLLYLGFGAVWLFQLAVLVLFVEALEEIAITTVLSKWQANVPSLFAARRIARAGAALLLLLLPAFAFAQLPDLRPEVTQLHVEFGTTVSSGDVVEGCAGATTGRDLVRMSLTTRNDGDGAEELGNPMCPDCATHPNEVCGNPLFICSPAGGHNHAHYQNFLRYEVIDPLDPNATPLGMGGKRSFCLAESLCDPGFGGGHTCNNQGLEPHCRDIYTYSLGCQYVDVTNVPDGQYVLRVTVDPLSQISEADETNNVIDTPVTLSRGDRDDVSLEGSSLSLKHDKVVKLHTRTPDSADLSGPANDPTQTGGTLYVTDTPDGTQIGFPLVAGGWKRIGKAEAPKGYRYRGDGSSEDPCTSVKVSRNGVKAQCRLNGEHGHFDLPAQGELFVHLELGPFDRRFCASFGGRTLRNDAVAVKRKGSPAADCDPTQ